MTEKETKAHARAPQRGTDGLTDEERAENHENSIKAIRRQAAHSRDEAGKASGPHAETIRREHEGSAARLEATAAKMEKEGPKAPT